MLSVSTEPHQKFQSSSILLIHNFHRKKRWGPNPLPSFYNLKIPTTSYSALGNRIKARIFHSLQHFCTSGSHNQLDLHVFKHSDHLLRNNVLFSLQGFLPDRWQIAFHQAESIHPKSVQPIALFMVNFTECPIRKNAALAIKQNPIWIWREWQINTGQSPLLLGISYKFHP